MKIFVTPIDHLKILHLCGSAGLPSRTLEAGDLAGELDAVEALREVLRVHPEIKTFDVREVLRAHPDIKTFDVREVLRVHTEIKTLDEKLVAQEILTFDSEVF